MKFHTFRISTKMQDNVVQKTKAIYTQKLPIRRCYYVMRGLIFDPFNECYHTYAYNLQLVTLQYEPHYCFLKYYFYEF